MPPHRTRGAGSAALRLVPALCLVLAAAAAAGGLALVASLRTEGATPSAEIDGLQLRLERASWVDLAPEVPTESRGHLDATATWPGPRSNAQGSPSPADRRLALTLVARNATRSEQRFSWGDLVLRAEGVTSPRAAAAAGVAPPAGQREGASPSADDVPIARLTEGETAIPAGHAVVLDATFDVRDSGAALALWWERGAARQRLLATRIPQGPARSAGPPRRWPAAFSELPAGRAAAGDRLFHGRLACASCHGDPAMPGSSGAGPDLGGIGSAAGLRQRGRSAPQYLYESILDPAAFSSPACAGRPCASVQMPGYGEVLSLQDAADLVAYLLAQRSVAAR